MREELEARYEALIARRETMLVQVAQHNGAIREVERLLDMLDEETEDAEPDTERHYSL
jgi:hypothetical protein